MRKIFVNLPVKDLKAAMGFFSELGFTYHPDYTGDDGACMIVDENIFVMLVTEPRFKDFINNDISDATRATEVLTCLSAESREEVDDLVAKALAAGGTAWKPKMDYGTMYGGSFQDLDGHVWELMFMEPAS
ncbi:MAG: VOC family protein [Chloroflexota bacterium]